MFIYIISPFYKIKNAACVPKNSSIGRHWHAHVRGPTGCTSCLYTLKASSNITKEKTTGEYNTLVSMQWRNHCEQDATGSRVHSEHRKADILQAYECFATVSCFPLKKLLSVLLFKGKGEHNAKSMCLYKSFASDFYAWKLACCEFGWSKCPAISIVWDNIVMHAVFY